jgi:AcrR family transcriptional regulator
MKKARSTKAASTRTASPKVRQTRDADATRAKILAAALVEFGNRGLAETRTDDIAARCKINKRMIFYYFGSKEGLYLAALESVYADLANLERQIAVEHLDPVTAIATMINLKIDYYLDNPHFITFLSMENLYKAKNLRKSKRIGEFKTPLTRVIGRILERGEKLKVFRKGIDPIDLYISICALCFMYFSNQHTLGVIFARDLMSADGLARRRHTVVDLVTSYLQQPAKGLPAQMRAATSEIHLVAL